MLRPMWKLCSPTWLTQPTITSSIAAGSIPLRPTKRIEHGGTKVGGMPFTQGPTAPPTCRAQRFDNISFGHQLPFVSVDQASTKVPVLESARALSTSISAQLPGAKPSTGASIGSS